MKTESLDIILELIRLQSQSSLQRMAVLTGVFRDNFPREIYRHYEQAETALEEVVDHLIKAERARREFSNEN